MKGIFHTCQFREVLCSLIRRPRNMIFFKSKPPCYIVFFFVRFKMEFGAALLHVWSRHHFSTHEVAMHLHACDFP